jgi:hypothetical protein
MGPRGGLWSVLLVGSHKEGLCISSGDINRLMMMMMTLRYARPTISTSANVGSVLDCDLPLGFDLQRNGLGANDGKCSRDERLKGADRLEHSLVTEQ